jgi:phosphate acyltransferase
MKIVVDAMGGDFAPQNPVAGAIDALRHAQNRFTIVLTGLEDQVRAELQKHDTAGLTIEVVHTPQVIDMHEPPATALKTKPNSSMMVGLQYCKEGKADGFVSAGSTGAQMAGSLFILGRVAGVQRPTIGSYFPTMKGVTMVFDVGASIDCKPEHLVQFAEMGSIYLKDSQNIEKPTVGLLNIGEEDTKGTDAAKLAFTELKAASLEGKINFVGNVEGRDILKGTVNVVVCDGFVGNIVLKFGESVQDFLSAVFKEDIGKMVASGKITKEQAGLFGSIIKETLSHFDDEQYGGVPLLGINGVSIISHGSSSPKAIMNAIFRAEEMIDRKVNLHIAEMLKEKKA